VKLPATLKWGFVGAPFTAFLGSVGIITLKAACIIGGSMAWLQLLFSLSLSLSLPVS